ncbi:hypothetical protein [Microbulbifer sediminum]|uniref:hypothetical protein n=1 Tax=Microbulbifer sediminum TaxID=2904250 RepID=UPI001F4746F0|nr:hypothetical protein [Microbulbifer sediminum]
MKALLINVTGLVGSWHLIDVASDNVMRSGIAPVIFSFFLISSLLWLIVAFGRNQRVTVSHYSSADSPGISHGEHAGGGDGGGDGGA